MVRQWPPPTQILLCLSNPLEINVSGKRLLPSGENLFSGTGRERRGRDGDEMLTLTKNISRLIGFGGRNVLIEIKGDFRGSSVPLN